MTVLKLGKKPQATRRLPELVAIATIGTGLLLSTACGPNCQSTCQRIYSSSDCNIAVAGYDTTEGRAELIRQCVADCEYALRFSGDIGDYNPNDRHTSGETVELENEKQAAEWMDCVNAVDCSQLADGFCAPI